MKNKELIKELSNRVNWTSEEVSDVISQMSNLISTHLADEDVVYLEGFGQFETRKKGERISVNPANGKRYLVPPKLVPVFKPDGAVKIKLKELGNNE
ncbi:MAG: HU family DNA-binding protein [Tannerellaceae bacterium]|jgi:DNA-binding protein HU-beta|nr:HU family DNA-binding protein [Tannerellaceae bacterium]